MSFSNPPTAGSEYAGRWVAKEGERVIAQGGTPSQVQKAAWAIRSKHPARIEYVPLGRPLHFPDTLETVTAVLPEGVSVYLSGGAVRDALLGRPVHDLDFVLEGDVLRLSRSVADRIGAAWYPLDQERGTARLVFTQPDGSRLVLDFAAFRGPDLDADLFGRDYTINAMAVDVGRTQELLDPTGGAADLRTRRLRACSPVSLMDDPVRVLRGVRLAGELNLQIELGTAELMRLAVPHLDRISAERKRDELFRILNNPKPLASIHVLDRLGALQRLLPELDDLKGVQQSPPHVSDVWNHTLTAVQKLGNVLDVLSPVYNPDLSNNLMMGTLVMQLGRFRQTIDAHLAHMLNPDRTLRSLLCLAALYHDVAKPGSRSVEAGGRIRFFGHDEEGAEVVEKRGHELRLSLQEISRLKTIVRHHMRPFLLANSGSLPSRRAIYRFFRDTGEAGIDICLVALADVLATYGPTLTLEVWARHLEVTGMLMDAYWNRPEESVSPEPLINGNDLMAEMGIEPGVQVGRLLAEIREAQADGTVTTREQAVELARSLNTSEPPGEET